MPEEILPNTNMSERTTTRIKKTKTTRKAILLLISYIIVAILVWNIHDGFSNNPEKQQAKAAKEVQNIVKKVSHLMILPKYETPTVIKVDNADALSKTQSFFADVQNKDVIIVYEKSQKAIIYRPDTNKIINAGPVVGDNQSPPVSNTSSSTSTKSK